MATTDERRKMYRIELFGEETTEFEMSLTDQEAALLRRVARRAEQSADRIPWSPSMRISRAARR